VYHLFSTVFLYPDRGRLTTVSIVAGELWEQDGSLATFPFFIQWREFLDKFRSLADLDAAKVEEEYVNLFLASSDYSPCFPYESAYIESGSASGWIAAELEQEYAAAALSISSSFGESPDHVAVELEFLSFLCDQEAKAWEGRRLTEGTDALKRQAKFLDKHLSRWFPAFARRVIGKNGSEIYTAVTRAIQAFVAHDSDLVKALGERFESISEARLADLTSKMPQQGM
jgi:anaerobic sulfite reductase subunit A